jgi:hypothetical protein
VLPIPQDPATQKIGVLLFTRSDVSLKQYDPLLQAIEAQSNQHIKLSVGAVDKNASVAATLASLDCTDGLLVAGHGMTGGADGSSSGQLAQAWARTQTQHKVHGLVLIAGFLERTQRPSVRSCLEKQSIQPKRSLKHPLGYLEDGSHDCHGDNKVDFPVPVLTVAGELDGLVRVTRVAEAYHTQINLSKRTKDSFTVVDGMAHSSVFTSATALPSSASAKDIKPQRDGDACRKDIAAAVASFVGDISNPHSETAVQHLEGDFFQPLIEAFAVQEGSWFFTGGDDEHGSSQWAAAAQERMATPLPSRAQRWTMSTNEFHLLSDEDKIPPYYRTKHRPTVEFTKGDFESTTIAQLRYIEESVKQTKAGLDGYAIIKEEKLAILADGLKGDDGSDFASAIEIATKLRSRQATYNASAAANQSVALDSGDRCADINQAAIDWALANASPKARQSFKHSEVTFKPMPDVKPFPPAGPFWIWKYLQYELQGKTLEMTAPFAFYALDANPYGAGNHYCKLLSPARVMEWIYTASLNAPVMQDKLLAVL